MARHTPLYDRHLAAGARMVDFAGYDMPLQYSGIREEHLAVRERAGLFDVSHMGEVRVSGEGAAAFVQRLVTNDASKLSDRDLMYSVMCNHDGGIVDDVIAWRSSPTEWVIIVNAATRQKDVAHIRALAGDTVGITDVSDGIALLAVQGPRAVDILEPIAKLNEGRSLRDMKAFTSSGLSLAGIAEARVQQVSRTGYTGEDGFELYIDADHAVRAWDAILAAGAAHGLVPAGLGARDTLRLEAGLRLYGQDMDESTDPFSVGLGWTVKIDKGDFVGADRLRELKASPPKRFVGLTLGPRHIARHGQRVLQGDREVGEVTSGTMGITVGMPVATAIVDPSFDRDGDVSVDIRGTAASAEVVPLPFYKRPRGDR